MSTVARHVPPVPRILFEKLLLVFSLISLACVGLLHFTYVSTFFNNSNVTSNCLSLPFEIDSGSHLLRSGNISFDILGIHIVNSKFATDETPTLTWNTKECVDDGSNHHDDAHLYAMLPIFNNLVAENTTRSYYFSVEKGYLLLPAHALKAHNVTRADLRISTHSECFGPSASALLLRTVVGYDTAVKNWLIRSFFGQGFLLNSYSEEIYDLNLAADFVQRTGASVGSGMINSFTGVHSWQHYIAFKLGVVLMTLFLFFTTTTLVSFTLRVTQERMLKFTFLLNYNISHRIPYASLVLTHLVESLVFVPLMGGVIFFLFEFFLDRVLAFFVLSLVWAAEVYSVVNLRTQTSINYFPKIFFVYFSVFHIYFFCIPFGFSYPALFTTVLFLGHAMFSFWNYWEVPAFESGVITALHPRHGIQVNTEIAGANNSSNNTATSTRPGTAPAATATTGAGNSNSNGNNRGGLNQSVRRPSFHQPATRRVQGARENMFTPLSPADPRSSIDSYSRHVELSRRIQHQQMVAIMGFDNTNNVGLDLDDMYTAATNTATATATGVNTSSTTTATRRSNSSRSNNSSNGLNTQRSDSAEFNTQTASFM